MTTTPQEQLRAARTDLDDDSAVVVIGSGAGGGTLAREPAGRGVTVVLLGAGPRLTGEERERVNDEWEAVHLMAWPDPRTTTHRSGATPGLGRHVEVLHGPPDADGRADLLAQGRVQGVHGAAPAVAPRAGGTSGVVSRR